MTQVCPRCALTSPESAATCDCGFLLKPAKNLRGVADIDFKSSKTDKPTTPDESKPPQEPASWAASWDDIWESVKMWSSVLIVLALIIGGGYWLFTEGPKLVKTQYMQWSCRRNLQADLDELLGPEVDPEVKKCTGNWHKATCLVTVLEKGTYKTEPMKVKCSDRYFSAGMGTAVRTGDATAKQKMTTAMDLWMKDRAALEQPPP